MGRVVIMVLLLAVHFLSCIRNTSPECPENKPAKDKGAVFLLGHQFVVSPYLNKVIQTAGIDKSGYALIISDAIVSDTGKFRGLLHALNYYKIFAVHDLHFEKDRELTKADEITIEHAGLIFLILTDQQARVDFLDHQSMVSLVTRVQSNGATMAGIAYGADLMGDYILVVSDTAIDGIALKQGLQFLNGFVVGRSGAIQKDRTALQDKLQQNELVFVGLSPNDGLQLCGNDMLIVESSGLEIISSNYGKETGNLSKGDLINPEK
jgi:hypothetical protein